ncbi:Methylated-DNA--protein-cysteine methyltransferase [Pseudoruegeria aquimaris]|uniref:Methylated-DNA--protein-cysteine methyltransferase n=1 Tax=Pseudoruegeria aquimaris TaxID=393663 RepID=A0A1Y5TKM3_9RHOB|nr:methylated-DNA--[protein]-cysteine S-methyltransferase [Pseudoruegeria aquimaris]SLN62623.1 Methylated-DNA--protein-cysteine methyltransferase [Pseudoruegeria aquimaris]
MTACLTIDSPLGPLTLHAQDGAITALTWEEATDAQAPTPLLQEAAAQLAAYFDGRLTRFDLPLRVEGSDFQKAVCAQMSAIPYGETRTYGDLARALGQPAQAVGGACGANPIPILIPCHRVVGANGLTGFSGAGGVETKAALLRLEGALLI